MQETRPATTRSGIPVRPSSGTPETAQKPKLLDRLREALRSRHYSRRTEQTYCHWLKRLIFFVKTTMIYTHVLNRGPAGVRSPVDGL